MQITRFKSPSSNLSYSDFRHEISQGGRPIWQRSSSLLGTSSLWKRRSSQSVLCRFVTLIFRLLPYAIFFVSGAVVALTLAVSLTPVSPCGTSLGETLLNYYANVTNKHWNTSITKYRIECPRYPPALVGSLPYPLKKAPTFQDLDHLFGLSSEVLGGHFRPDWCHAVNRVAIIVPYRDREENLRSFLFYMHTVMRHQLLDYAIIIVEQTGSSKVRFNRGLLLNAGFAEAMKAYKFDCALFYDVDKVPVDDRCSHVCPPQRQVRHMGAFQDRFERQPFRDDYFGGVLAINAADFQEINGFSNIFFGYGYEDDEFLRRIRLRNLTAYREHELLSRYRNLDHPGDGLKMFPQFDWKHEKLFGQEKTLHPCFHPCFLKHQFGQGIGKLQKAQSVFAITKIQYQWIPPQSPKSLAMQFLHEILTIGQKK